MVTAYIGTMVDNNALSTPCDELICRICWGREERASGDGALIAPCLCSGTIKWVHTSCLNTWCLSQRREKSREAATHCEMCRTKYQIPIDARQAFDEEIWEGFVPGPRTLGKRLWRSLMRVEREAAARSALEWLVETPLQAIMLGGFVRGMRTSGPFARQFGTLALFGFQAGAAALARRLPHLLLLTACLPPRLRVSLLVSAGTYLTVLGLQVPVCTVMGANIGWCFGYAVGCAETATALKAIAVHIARPFLGCLQAVAGFGLARFQVGLNRARLR